MLFDEARFYIFALIDGECWNSDCQKYIKNKITVMIKVDCFVGLVVQIGISLRTKT